MISGHLTSWFLLFGCNLMWALQFTCIKLVQDQVGVFSTVWGPMALAMFLLYPLVRGESRQARLTRQDTFRYLLLAAMGVFPGQILMTWGTRMSLASNAALIQLTLPVTTAFFAFLFLRERMTRVRWISFVIAIAGVALCSGIEMAELDFGAQYWRGNSLILLATTGSAFYNSYGKKMLRRHSPVRMLFCTYVATTALVSPVVLTEERELFSNIAGFVPQTWIGLALLTVFHNYLSMVLFLKALKRLDATQTALSNYLITLFGLPIAAIWLGERLTPLAILGGVMILGSTLLITLWNDRRSIEAEKGKA